MTHHSEMRFVCDGINCHTEVYLPSSESVQSGTVKPPKDWTVVWINNVTILPRHFCQDCSLKFFKLLVEVKQ